MKPKRTLLLALLVWLALPASLQAQGPVGAPEDSKSERIHDLIMQRLNAELGLNPTQSQQLAQIMRKYQQQRLTLKRQQRDLTAQLRAASTSGNDAQVQPLLQKLTATRSQLDQVNDQMFNEIRPMLTPMQQAKYLLVMDEIRQEVKAIRRPVAPGYYPPPGAGTPSQDAVRVGPPYY
ncbi:hypothetical protein FBR05_12085 [Deltaproteobacteria bacterium PRO3]|nr:hypothetical protein [Deltaproteobacteria bacterium PRO3]